MKPCSKTFCCVPVISPFCHKYNLFLIWFIFLTCNYCDAQITGFKKPIMFKCLSIFSVMPSFHTGICRSIFSIQKILERSRKLTRCWVLLYIRDKCQVADYKWQSYLTPTTLYLDTNLVIDFCNCYFFLPKRHSCVTDGIVTCYLMGEIRCHCEREVDADSCYFRD